MSTEWYVRDYSCSQFDTVPLSLQILSKVQLFNTLEIMGSNFFVPIIRGRSSVGRLGIFINITADLIDIGSINQWTLQLHCIAPVKVYPGMLIGQVTFWKVDGEITLYSGKYAKYESPVPSLSFLDEFLPNQY